MVMAGSHSDLWSHNLHCYHRNRLQSPCPCTSWLWQRYRGNLRRDEYPIVFARRGKYVNVIALHRVQMLELSSVLWIAESGGDPPARAGVEQHEIDRLVWLAA